MVTIKKYKLPEYAVKTAADKLALEKGYYWDDTEANRVCNFITRYCVQSKGGWSGTIELLDFQKEDIIFPFYSWKKPNGSPRFNTMLAFGPRKWGKSFLCGSCLGAYHLFTEKRSEILLLASTVAQTKVIYDTIANFGQSPALTNRLHVKEHINEIRDKVGKGKLKVLSSTNVQGQSGWNTSLIVADEFCEWRSSIATAIYGRLKNSDIAKLGGGGRKIWISTPQDDINHPGKRLWQNAKDIQEGESLDLHTLPVVYGADMDDDPSKESTWFKAQPALGKIIPVQAYRDDYEQSKEDPHEFARFKTLLLGTWVGAVNAFISTNVWSECAQDFTEDDFHGEECIMACDFGGRYDLLSHVLIFKRDGKYYVLPRFGLPEKIIERKAKSESKDYVGWATSGLIKVCPGEVVDLQWWHNWIEDDMKNFNVKVVCIDDYNLESTRQWLEDEKGVDVITVKSWVYNEIGPLTSLFESMVKEKTIVHNNNPVLNWNLENTTIKIDDSGKIKPDKRKGSAKIDGIVACIVGLAGLETLNEVNDFCGVL